MKNSFLILQEPASSIFKLPVVDHIDFQSAKRKRKLHSHVEGKQCHEYQLTIYEDNKHPLTR